MTYGTKLIKTKTTKLRIIMTKPISRTNNFKNSKTK